MTEAEAFRSFVVDFLRREGASVSEEGPLLWIGAGSPLAEEVGLGARFALTFDSDASGRFEAEVIAPGSYGLERLLAAAMRRGRTGGSAFRVESAEWARGTLEGAGLLGLGAAELGRAAVSETTLLVFAFRVTLTSDEKVEAFQLVAVDERGEAWPVPSDRLDGDLVDDAAPAWIPDLGAGYRSAASALEGALAGTVETFRSASVRMLDEEVRRILQYYDRTVQEIRAANAPGVADFVRAVESERDRRLGEALERFDPKAVASLVSVRAVRVPTARLSLAPAREGAASLDVRVDAWTRRVRGARCEGCGDPAGPWTWEPGSGLRCAPCASTSAGSARPRGRPRSGTLRRGTTAGRGTARSPRGSKARSPAAGGSRRSG